MQTRQTTYLNFKKRVNKLNLQKTRKKNSKKTGINDLYFRR